MENLNPQMIPQDVIAWLQSYFGQTSDLQTRFLASLAIIVLLWLTRWLSIRVVNRRFDDVEIYYRWRKISSYVVAVLGVFLVGRLWLQGIHSIATFLGLVSAGVAIALREPLANVAGWAFIMWRRPFGVGDRVQIGEFAGDVIDTRIFAFTLLEIGGWVKADQSTGRIVHVPNAQVFSQPLANYTKGFGYIWNEIPVLVTFESNWQRAKELLQEIVNRHTEHLSESAQERVRRAAQRYMIFYPTLTPIVYTHVEASGVLLTIRYLSEPRRRRSSEQAIWEDVLRAFAAHEDIEFAYPTQRFYARWREETAPTDGRHALGETFTHDEGETSL